MSSSYANRVGGTLSLEQKMLNVLQQDDTGDGPFGVAGKRPGWAGLQLSTFELDLRDWGLVYGFALGIARCEDPFETNEQVAARAFEAAWPVFMVTNSGFANRDPDNAAREVCRRYHQAGEAQGTETPTVSRELAEALQELERTVGH